MTDSARPPRRTRGHWLVAVPVGTALALALSWAVWTFTGVGDRSTDDDSVDAAGVIAAGEARPPHALWLFGFDTLRVVPDGSVPVERLGRRMFGSLAGGSGAVFMFDPAQGRAGVLDTARTQVTTAEVSEPWAAPIPEETVSAAPDGGTAWIATGPGVVARLDQDLHAQTTALAPGAADTWVAALDDGAIVAVPGARGVNVARLDATGAARTQVLVPLPAALGTPIGVDATDDTVWLVGEHGALALGTSDLEPIGDAALDGGAGPIRAHVPAGAALWVAAEDGAAAYRLEPGRAAVRVELLATRPAEFRGQVDLAAGLGAVWALVPTGDTGTAARAATVARIDPADPRVTDTLSVPAEVFAGRIATT